MSTMKRCISLLLAMLILVGVFSPGAQAASLVETASVNTDNVTIEGTNGFGNLLSQEITENQEESEAADAEYPGGYAVTDLVIEGNTATVTYDTMEEATLVVALYTEDGMQMVTSTTTTVSPDTTEAALIFEGEVPEYFMASAYLLDAYDFSPLCAAYDTPMYTQEMQELLASTVNDYDPEKVLNLDDDETTNFAVYADSTIVIEAIEGHNIVASIDDENSIYIIENADEQITTLTEDDIFAYAYTENEILIIKVASITINGTTVTITSADLEMEEVFSAAKIEGTSNTSEIILDDSTADDGVVFEGLQPNSGSAYETNAFEGGGSSDVRVSFKLKKETPKGNKAEGSIGFSVKVGVSYYISSTRQFLEVSTDTYFTGKIEAVGKIEFTIPLGAAYLVPVYGVKCFFEPEFVIRCEDTMSLDIQYGAFTKTVYESGKGITSYTTEKGWESGGETSIKFLVAIDLKPSVVFISRAVSELEMSVLVGLELGVEANGRDATGYDTVSDVVHSCMTCFDLELKFIAEFKASVTILKYIEIETKPMRLEALIFDAYLSGDYGELRFGDCPHLEYRITVKVTDELGNGIPGIEVCTNDESVWGVTNTHGVIVKYLPSGKYTVNAMVDSQELHKSFEVSEAMYVSISIVNNEVSEDKTIFDTTPTDTILDCGLVVASGKCGDDLTWTLYASGLLTIDGHGAMVDYSWRGAPWYSNRNMIEEVIIGSNVTSIGVYAFNECYNLRSVTISDSVTSIEKYAFCDCTSLNAVMIPSSITSIDEYAFAWCYSLSSVTIPDSVTFIGDGAFHRCDSLMGIHVDVNNLNYSSDDRGVLHNKDQSKLLRAPGGITGEYEILTSVTSIGESAFCDCTGLSIVTIPNSIISIGESAFYWCTSLSNVIIPDSVTTIADNAFYGCSDLSNVTIGNSVTSIGDWVFTECNSLAGIWVDANNPNYSSDDTGVLFNKDQTELIQAPGGITGDYVIPDSVTSITIGAFYECENMSSVTIGTGITDINAYAFARCYNLNSITFEGDAPSFGSYVFNNVTTIARYPSLNPTWTTDVMQNYGGTITWMPYTPGEEFAGVAVSKASVVQFGDDPQTEISVNAVYPGEYGTEVTDEYTLKTASFSGLVSGKQYVMLSMVNIEAEDPLTAENLLFIDQGVALEDGTLTFIYVQREAHDISHVVACGASNKDLADAEIIFPEMLADGESQVVAPEVVYGGETLTESRDYVIVGTVGFTVGGTYTCFIRGIRDYTGLVECNYVVSESQTENSFTDVQSGSFYYEPVMWAIENGITNGTSATTFGPNDQCMRAHVVTFLWRAVGSPEPTRTDNPFVDVKPSDFYYKPVLWALENGITSGMDATHFGPTSYCNRAQVVTFLYRTMGSPEVESAKNPFTDVASGSFYEKPVLWAVLNGVTSGMSVTSFGPSSICNRAQIVTFLYRAFVVS